jgi:hypothetical protein
VLCRSAGGTVGSKQGRTSKSQRHHWRGWTGGRRRGRQDRPGAAADGRKQGVMMWPTRPTAAELDRVGILERRSSVGVRSCCSRCAVSRAKRRAGLVAKPWKRGLLRGRPPGRAETGQVGRMDSRWIGVKRWPDDENGESARIPDCWKGRNSTAPHSDDIVGPASCRQPATLNSEKQGLARVRN